MPGPYSVVDFSCLIIPQTGLQYNAILKDRDLAEALLLGAGLLAGGNVQHELVQIGTGLVQRALAVRDDTGVEVDPGLFSGGQLAVGGNFQRRRGGTKRRAAARAEQHHVRTRSSQRRGGDQVVAGAVQHVQALGGDGLAVVDDIHDRRGAALLHAAAGLVLQRRNAALLVARARVVVDDLIVADEVLFEAVDHPDGLLKDLLVLAAVHQEALGTEHLGHLGQHSGAAAGAQHIAEAANRRVGGDAGQTVRAAALHADDQLAGRDRLTLKLRGVGGQLFQDLASRDQLVLNVLAGQELDAVMVVVAQLGQKLLMGQVFAAQAQHQNRARVGVAHQRGQQLAGLCVVMAGLGAAERMGEGIQPVDAAGHKVLIVAHERLGAVVDAADSRDDPDLVADGSAAILAAVAHEGVRRGGGQRVHIGVIAVLDLTGEVRVDVVGVHPGAGHGVRRGVADGKAVFDDVFAAFDGRNGHLVALGNVLNGGDGGVIDGDCRAFGDGMQGDDDVVLGVDLNGDRHKMSP